MGKEKVLVPTDRGGVYAYALPDQLPSEAKIEAFNSSVLELVARLATGKNGVAVEEIRRALGVGNNCARRRLLMAFRAGKISLIAREAGSRTRWPRLFAFPAQGNGNNERREASDKKPQPEAKSASQLPIVFDQKLRRAIEDNHQLLPDAAHKALVYYMPALEAEVIKTRGEKDAAAKRVEELESMCREYDSINDALRARVKNLEAELEREKRDGEAARRTCDAIAARGVDDIAKAMLGGELASTLIGESVVAVA